MEAAELLCRLFLLAASAHWTRSLETGDADAPDNADEKFTTESTAVATTDLSFRHPRWYKRGGYHADDDDDDEEDDHTADDETEDDNVEQNKALTNGKSDPYGGYYDFLINEGSYKFWAVFQLATAALLIYSGFAAAYYAKVNPPASPDYEDYYLRRRRRRRRSDDFLGLGPTTFQRIVDAVSGYPQPHRASA